MIASTITFMGAGDDGTVDWHADGVPVSEIIPLSIDDDAEGGDLAVFGGNYEVALARLAAGEQIPLHETHTFSHHMGQATLGQLMRALQRVTPMTRGRRISLNLNARSRERPFVDDNPMYYLGADNPTFDWVEEYVQDVKERQLPAYLSAQASA